MLQAGEVSMTPLKRNQMCLVKDERGQIMPHPDCYESAVRYGKWKVGQPRIVEVKIERNYQFLAKYFKMLSTVFDNQDRWEDKDIFRKHTLIKIGWSTRFFDPKSKEVFEIPDTISFAKCTESEFQDVYKKTVDYLMREYCFDDDMFMMLMSYL